jgi:hypothetical protein
MLLHINGKYTIGKLKLPIWSLRFILTRVTRRMTHVEYELLTLPRHMSSSLILVLFVLFEC